ncbi:MAG: hypothetical protein HZB38_05180 [Planctomycetes bacterium]|nr:hypothetical protein [Planctomycetota bacterium]
MNRAEFERLLSDWLDEPLRADLFALIERAGKQSPELAALRDQWRRVHALTRDDPKPLASVDWATRPAAIRAAIDADIEKAMQRGELDSVLALGGRSLNAVDWKGQRERIGAAIEAAVHDELRPGRLDEVLAAAASPAVDWQEQQVAVRRTLAARRRLRIFGFAAGITAAAAAIERSAGRSSRWPTRRAKTRAARNRVWRILRRRANSPGRKRPRRNSGAGFG